jgi:hypothetical protein
VNRQFGHPDGPDKKHHYEDRQQKVRDHNQRGTGHSVFLLFRESLPFQELFHRCARVLDIILIVQQAFHVLCAQRTESVDQTLATLVSLGSAFETLGHPAGASIVLVPRTTPARLGAAGKQIPTRQKGLHPADSLGIQSQVLKHVVDVSDTPDVLV